MTARFIVKGWGISGDQVSLSYECDGHSLREILTFPFPVDSSPVVDRLLDLLSVVAGVSYAKAFAPASVAFPSLDLSPSGLELVARTYDEGMREFAFENGLALSSPFTLDGTARAVARAHEPTGGRQRPLVPFGGGRDSCVVASALLHLSPTLFSVGDNPYAAAIAATLGLEHVSVGREIDPGLLALNNAGAPNGHVPVTAINSLISLVYAQLTGHTSVVMANEKSASRPTRVVDGVEVNHQFSKSHAYERLLSDAVRDTGSPVAYLSVLRNVHDRDLSRAFALRCTPLHHGFMSCNRAMVRDSSQRSNGWCNSCAKCRGVFLSLAPFLPPARMISIFGTDLLADPDQFDGFAALLTDGDKPFECVADVEEARESVRSLAGQFEWTDHVVVRLLARLAGQGGPQRDDDTGGASLFAAEMDAFLRSTT